MPELDIHLDETDRSAQLRADAYAGLLAAPKWLPPKWFYDARGSDLFEEITRLPEYYPTKLERDLLAAQADRIAAITGARTLVELGSGSSEKTRLLLDALHRRGDLATFVPLDVSAAALADAVALLSADYPQLRIEGVVADFHQHLKLLPGSGDRLVAFLGGTIGNLAPAERARFLAELRATLEPGEWLLLGAGLVTDPQVMVPAYDDAAGVTAEFNRNVLRVLNRELDADFDVEAFEHVAVWDPEREWIEMRLRAARAMSVTLPAIGVTIEFATGEELRTEISAKFRRDLLAEELAAAGFNLRHWWTDPAGRFSLSLAETG
ncbi:L-histidine N(alpha)-methyltransferase [Natronosporangium hydrolyticum]|uniref:Histidine N-alpha-methyltransferase n=2 Tax=Natronosporangium hydrolyticum TaxID=2811111 RepID=A0A895YK20_9ACTN|nr:L-histidine N(alpha)-methyltransferase [Natronosporangium hydrolyticum]